MKGAIAEPLVSTIKPPKITIMIRIGSSQNFLRSRMNAQSSTMMDPISTSSMSELVAHRLRRRAGRRALDPIALGGAVDLHPQEILAECAHQQADRHDGDEEQQPQHDRVHDLVDQQAELGPKLVERRQYARRRIGCDQKDSCQRQHPMPAHAAFPIGKRRGKREEASEDLSESTIRTAFDVVFAAIVFVTVIGGHVRDYRTIIMGAPKSLISHIKATYFSVLRAARLLPACARTGREASAATPRPRDRSSIPNAGAGRSRRPRTTRRQ